MGIVHPEAETWKLVEKTFYYETPPPCRWKRLCHAGGLMWRFPQKRMLFSLLRTVRPGRFAHFLNLLHRANAFIKNGTSFDVIHCHFGPNGSYTASLRAHGIITGRLVTTFHGYDLSMIPRTHGDDVYADLFKVGDLFLPVSQYFKTRLISMGCPENLIVVHYLGIPMEKWRFKSRVFSSSTKHRLVSVCRLVEKKGLQFALEAAALLSAQEVDFEYVIIGEGELRPALEDMIECKNLIERVKLVGAMDSDNIAKILESSDIFLAPSVVASDGNEEGIPIVMLEAMASGLPVVSTLHAGIPEVIKNGITGYLVPERDSEALALCLRSAFEHPERLSSIALAARNFVESFRNGEEQHAELQAIFRNQISAGTK